MPDAIKTLGTTLQMSQEIGSPQNFVSVGNLTDFSGPDGSRNIISTSNLLSDGASKMAGLLDEGNFSFTINYDPSNASHQAIWTAKGDGGIREFKVTLVDSGAAEIHFNGIVTNFPFNGPFDDKVTVQLNVAITGRAWITY